MTISRGQMPRELYEQGSLSPEMEQMVQTVMKMTGVSREEAILMIQTMENPKEVTNEDFTSMQEGYQLEPRQEYGLGSIVKSVTKAVKKVADSPIGKAALIYAGAAGLGALGAGTGFSGFTSSLLSPTTVAKNLALSGKGFLTGATGGAIQFPGAAVANTAPGAFKLGSLLSGKTGAIAGASILSGIFGSKEKAQELRGRDPAEFNAKVQQYVKNLNPDEKETALKLIQEDIAKLGDVSQAEQIFARNVAPVTLAAEGGIMGIPTGEMRQNPEGVMERDYRDEGGFVPVGIKEKADDVPAMLSKNEFVMTADAVRGAGNGDIEKGAQIMYDNMKRLESRIV